MMIAFHLDWHPECRNLLRFEAVDLMHYQYPKKIGRNYTAYLPIVGVVIGVSVQQKQPACIQDDREYERVFPTLTKLFRL